MTPQVSVVITHYNHLEFLPEALGSIVQQSIQPYEVILVDDGSDNRLLDIQNTHKNMTTVYAPHRGIGATLNTAISIMRGNVFCWLPADDIWEPHKLEMQTRFAKRYPDCVLHSYSTILADGKTLPREVEGKVEELSDDEFKKAIRNRSPYFGNTFWIPRNTLEVVGPFREDVPACEDYEWVLRSSVKHGIRYRLQKEWLTVNRMHTNTTTVKHQIDVPGLVQRFNMELGK